MTNITKFLEVKSNPAYTANNFATQWESFKTNLDSEIIFLSLSAPKLASMDYNSSSMFMNITKAQNDSLAQQQAALI